MTTLAPAGPAAPASAAVAVPSRSRRVPPPAMVWVGLGIVAVFVVVAGLAPAVAPYDPLAQNVTDALAAPSWQHLLGTDELGRDVLSRLIWAARIDLLIGFLGAALPAVVGTVLGALAGYFGGWVDTLVMRVSDLVQAFPSYILVIALVFVLGAGPVSILVSMTLVSWVAYVRLMRTEMLRVRESDYIAAAKVSGFSRQRVLWRHAFPNSIGQSLVYLPSDIVAATLGLAALSFLGLGIQPPTPEWGAMIAEGQPYIREQWWLATVPGLVIVVFGLGLSMIGEGVEAWGRE
ncbi:ABC transporter permease [Leifsonia shinshuensis]|uniref:Peptide/nickel transport system permease protein n=1 Tax=Leifsonia shinshuensis TaxID=150026 RepID=A0A853CYX8_9MICO|nr:ABC transporter permease [Leifsonia shinshuensis]NYJ25768.1 peptide/nickel transport system permease protein [Leifsonia shinshuensis]